MRSVPSSSCNSFKTGRIISVNDFTHLYSSEKKFPAALIVYQNANSASSEPEIVQLLSRAKCVIPAVRNYLFFNASRVAVVYFGKQVNGNVKVGIREGAGDFKVKMIRFLTSEIWPPLLRTDAPDESLGTELVDSVPNKSTMLQAMEDDGGDVLTTARQRAEALQEREWVKKSLESSMEVLVYLKRAEHNTKYLKVILHNNTHRIHFDITDSRDEKFRWEGRKLFTRIMDNLESQKAVDSYESYSSYFREACEMAAAHSDELEQPMQPLLKAIVWSSVARLESSFHSCVSFPCSDSPKADPKLVSSVTSHCSEKPAYHLWKGEVVLSPILISSTNDEPCRRSPEQETQPDELSERMGEFSSSVGTRTGRYAECGSWVGTPYHGGTTPQSSPPSPLFRSLLASRPLSPQLTPPKFISFEFSPTRYYVWMTNLQKPESATLDYKSYMSHPTEEIIQRSVKFICGFLNAYREGKLIIGVHEIPRKSSSNPNHTGGATEGKKEGRNHLVLHNDLIDQFVVGVKMSEEDLEEAQRAVSEQLLNCVPPIPPIVVHMELVPIRFPESVVYSQRVLVLYDLAYPSISTQDAIKQRCNSAIRVLYPLGLSIVPMEITQEECDRMLFQQAGVDPSSYDSLTVEVFHIMAIEHASALENEEWEFKLLHALGPSGKRCNCFLTDSPRAMHEDPEVHVVEISVDMKRCPYPPLRRYKGKFFSGWPSIPIWDEITERVRPYPRNYHVWEAQCTLMNGSFGSLTRVEDSIRGVMAREETPEQVLSPLAEPRTPPAAASSAVRPCAKPKKESCSPQSSTGGEKCLSSEPQCLTLSVVEASPYEKENLSNFEQKKNDVKLKSSFQWYKQIHLVERILRFLLRSSSVDSLSTFRLIHPLWNSVFDNFFGKDVVRMIFRTPVGNPMLSIEWRNISRLQSSLQLSGVPPLPLLLCRVYELLGNFPSPFPYVSVPLQQQTFRLSPYLIPLFYYQSYFDGTIRLSVILDLRDSFIKLVQLRCGFLSLNCIGGVGFELMSNYKRISQMRGGQRAKPARRDSVVVNEVLLSSKRIPSPVFASSFNSDHPHSFSSKPFSLESSHPILGGKPFLVSHEPRTDRSSIIFSHPRDLYVTAKREVERDVPFLSFQFIGWNECQDRNTSFRDDANSFTTSSLSPPHQRPWSLFTLLNWFRSVLMDPKHVTNFGYCDRSFAFKFLRIEDICSSHFQSSILARLQSDRVSFSSEEKCLLHRREKMWRELPQYESGW